MEKSELVSSSETDWVWKRVWPSNVFGNYLIDIGELDQAEMYFKKALDLDQGRQYSAFSYWGLGRFAFQKEQYEKAQGYLQQALQLQPNYYIRSQVYLVYARIELAGGNNQEGIDYLRKAVNKDPENQGLHLLLAETMQKAGLLEEALKEYELYLTEWPDDTRIQGVFQELKDAIQSRAP